MDQAQIYFLEALRKSLKGEKYELCADSESVLRRIFHIAAIQNVLPMICEAVYQSESIKKYQGLFAIYKKQAVDQLVSQTVRTAQFLGLCRCLEKRGLTPVVVKGIMVRQLYPRENLRISVDEDLLIPSEQGEAYHQAFLDYGLVQMEEGKVWKRDPEISYTDHGSGLYIESHQYLLPPDSRAYGDLNRFFEHIEPVETEYKGQKLLTLDPTTHLFFLICHSFKHFLHSGFGIRQICDLVLFSDAYACEIDWEKIWAQCKEIRGQDFVRAMYQIGRKYLLPNNRYEEFLAPWHIEEADEEPLLIDVLGSGVHGAADMARLHSSNITLNAVVNNKNNKFTAPSVWRSVFLPLDSMKGRYRYLKKIPLLLPAAWVQRLFHYAKELRSGSHVGNNARTSMELGKRRVDLLKYYGIIK